MFKKFAVSLGLLGVLAVGGLVTFNSSRIDSICRILVNCQSFKEPYDTALILNRDAKSSLSNSRNIEDLRRVYGIVEKSSNAVSVAQIPSNYAEVNTLNSSNKELLDKVGDRINQEEKAQIYLKQAKDKAAEAGNLTGAGIKRILKNIQRINEASAAFNENLDRQATAFRLKQASEDTGVDFSLPEFAPRSDTFIAPEPEMSKEDEQKQQTIEYTKALALYKESLELVKSIPDNSFLGNEKIVLFGQYKEKVFSTEKFINTYLIQTIPPTN